MRKTEASVWMEQSSSRSLTRVLRLAVVALGIGIVMTAGAARAGDDDEDDGRTFEDKIIGNIIAGVGGTNMDNRGIDYRERSPLVVPPRLDLPPPVAATNEPKVANWPKDPDEKRRKAAIAERKKFDAKTVLEDARPLSPTELNPAGSGSAARRDSDPSQPGNPLDNSILSNNALGFNGSFGNVFASKPESATFKGEPKRDSLTQPPVGYQTPSPNYAYGIGTKDSMVRHSDPIADSVAGKP